MNLTATARLVVAGGASIVAAIFFSILSRQPDHAPIATVDPIVWIVVVGVVAGCCFLLLSGAVRAYTPTTTPTTYVIVAMVLVGLASRAILFASPPIWEIDYLRYLWDGGVLLAGENPYAWSPAEILAGQAPEALTNLAGESGGLSGGLVGQIGYPDLRTIYPPLAQAAFAAAHWISPWDITAWRGVLLVFDGTALGLLMLVLRETGKSPLWAALYWWNPLSIQMIFNAGHMDALLMPFLLAALLFSIRRRPYPVALALIGAVGMKLWPVLLAPLLLRYATRNRREFMAAAGLFAPGAVAMVAPIIWSGAGETSGLFAFASSWQRNDAVFGLIVDGVGSVFSGLDILGLDPARVTRLLVGAGLVVFACWPLKQVGTDALSGRALSIVVALFVFSPATYPWYFTWALPFVTVAPSFAVLAWTATLPLYYLRFLPWFIDNPDQFENGIVWFEHGPPIVLLALTWVKKKFAR